MRAADAPGPGGRRARSTGAPAPCPGRPPQKQMTMVMTRDEVTTAAAVTRLTAGLRRAAPGRERARCPRTWS